MLCIVSPLYFPNVSVKFLLFLKKVSVDLLWKAVWVVSVLWILSPSLEALKSGEARPPCRGRSARSLRKARSICSQPLARAQDLERSPRSAAYRSPKIELGDWYLAMPLHLLWLASEDATSLDEFGLASPALGLDFGLSFQGKTLVWFTGGRLRVSLEQNKTLEQSD